MTIPLDYQSPALRRLWPAYAVESFSSVGATLLGVGIFFYTEHRLAWHVRDNFLADRDLSQWLDLLSHLGIA